MADAAPADPPPPVLTPYTDFPYAVLPMPFDELALDDGVTPLQGQKPPAAAKGQHFEP